MAPTTGRRGVPRRGQALWGFLLCGLALLGSDVQASEPTLPVGPRRAVLPGLEWLQWSGGDLCRAGDPAIAVLVADPQKVRFRILHFRQQGEPGPLDLKGWQEKSGAPALFNAGQYYPDYAYMGLLRHEGKSIGPRLHPLFQGIFLAEPEDVRLPRTRIVDLLFDAFDPAGPGYGEAAQSFMLLDRTGAVRVRRTQNVAARTAVAEARDGAVWVLVTRGGYTLWEFAHLLREGAPQFRQVLAMDGGEEAQMLVESPGFRYETGVGSPQEGREAETPRWRRPLPTVIALSPRDPG